MTFEEYADTITWRTVAERTKAKAVWQYQQSRIDKLEAENKRILDHAVQLCMTTPAGYAIVPVSELKLIEDAIAFELGGEPCGLHEAHKLIKAIIAGVQFMETERLREKKKQIYEDLEDAVGE